jgi:hypothetical protein
MRPRSWQDEAGATTFEYAVMAALVLFALVLLVVASVAEPIEPASGSCGDHPPTRCARPSDPPAG